jgi:hypothetical protein
MVYIVIATRDRARQSYINSLSAQAKTHLIKLATSRYYASVVVSPSRASACSGDQDMKSLGPSSLQSCTGRGQIRFLGSALCATAPNLHNGSFSSKSGGATSHRIRHQLLQALPPPLIDDFVPLNDFK